MFKTFAIFIKICSLIIVVTLLSCTVLVLSSVRTGADKDLNTQSIGADNVPTISLKKLRLESWNWGKSSNSYVKAEGEVTNITKDPIKYVQVEVSWYDKSGTFITSEESTIDYNPIMPSQKSPFSVFATANPLMSHATIKFKIIGGQEIYFEVKPTPKPKLNGKKK